MTRFTKGQGARPADALAASFAAVFGGTTEAGLAAPLACALQLRHPEVPEVSNVSVVDVDGRDRSSLPRS